MRNSFPINITLILMLAISLTVAGQAPPKPRDTTIAGPQTFAMIMGISKYKYVRPLTYADKDAEMFRDYLKSPAGGKVAEDNIFCLLNEQAVSANFWSKGFKWLEAKKLRKGDKLFIYLAGHGDAIDEDEFFYITYDCNPAGDKNNYLAGGNVQLFNLKKKIAKETAKEVEVFFIMDACRTSEMPGGTEGQRFLNTAISEKRAGEIIMLATGAGQESLEDASIGSGHGLFTYYLVDGLTGEADTEKSKDNKITLEEIQKYVDRNVPSIAQQQFKRKQDPYFCCNENSEKVVSIVDTSYLRKWLETKKLQAKGAGTAVAPRGRAVFSPGDTLLIEAYNLFNSAVKESKLTGKESAEYYYQLMASKFPGDSYTVDAQTTLAVEFINFAQAKINLYLDCKDPASIQKIRAQLDEDDKSEELATSLDRMEKVSRQEFFEVGAMLEKAIEFIRPDDPDFAKSLEGRMYFFKARGYFGRNRKMVDKNQAFQYAYAAYTADKNAAYVLNTLSSLHLDNNRLDSAVYYAKRAIANAPRWRYPYVTLAFSYKTLNKPDSAIKYYKRAIDADPQNADAYVDLGHYYFSLSKNDSAILYYERALELEPANAYASNNIGWVNYNRKNYDKAAAFFKQAIKRDPKLINAYNGLSRVFFDTKQYDSARIYYAQAFSNYQDKSIVNVYIGNFYKELKEYDSAKVYYRLAAALDPSYEEAYNSLGRASFSLKQYDSATHYYRQALVANPYSAYALINMGMVFKELKEMDSTYKYFDHAVRLEPGNPSILNNLGVIYAEEKNYDSAKKYFRRALQVNPGYRPPSRNLLKIFRDQNQMDSVTNFLKGASLLDPNSASFMSDIGMAFAGQKRHDSAKIYLRRAIAKEPDNAYFYNNMGLVLHGMKQYDSARIYLQRAVRMDPENAYYWQNLSAAFRQLKQYDSAAYYYQKQILKRVEEGSQTYAAVGSYYMDMRVYDSAIAYYRRVLSIEPEHAGAWAQIGNSFLSLDRPDSALVYLSRSVLIDPNSPQAALNLGLVYHSLQQYGPAIEYIQKAILLDPTKGKTYYQLACSYALNKQPQEAIRYLRQAYERGYKNFDSMVTDPDLDALRNYKEFQALLDKYVPNWRERKPKP